MNRLEVLSTAGIPARQRLSYWNRVVNHAHTSRPPPCTRSDDFAAQITSAQVEEVVFFELVTAAATVRYPALNRPLMPARFILQIVVDGSSTSRQYGREARLTSGDFVMIDGRPSVSYESETLQPTRKLHMAIPCDLLRRYIAGPETVAAIRMPADVGVNGLVRTTLLEFWKRWTTTPGQLGGRRVLHALLELIAAAYENLPKTERLTRTSAEQHRAQIIAYIEPRLREASLSPTSIASALRMTVRNLHYVFACGDETVSQYIIRRRVEEGAHALRSVVLQGRTLTDIAYDCGFNGATQFGRAFRRHFHMTPSEYRHRELKS